MNKIKFLSAQPAIDYYAWQIEVQIVNLMLNGYDPEQIYVIAGYQDEIPESWLKLKKTHSSVNFFFYEDTLGDCKYLPAIQAHILKKHFKEHPDNTPYFFVDADFIFTRYLDFTPYLNNDNWYFSDTISYIGYDYIVSKGEEVLDAMCDVVGISKELVKLNQNNSGGAQKLMKNLTHEYWEMVEKYSFDLYDVMMQLQHVRNDGSNHGIQAWTASMWAELWTAWKLGIDVVVPKEFDFCWATCNIKRWDQVSFFHNAGVMSDKDGMFHKAKYMDKYPFNYNEVVSEHKCSYNYYKLLKSIDSCLV
jgi:hypothetical protein